MTGEMWRGASLRRGQLLEPADIFPEEDSFSIGSNSILHPAPPQLNSPRRTIFTDDTSGNLTGKSFSRSCPAADRRLSSPSTKSARSGRGELSNTRLNRAETGLFVIGPSFTVRDCASSDGACATSFRPAGGSRLSCAKRARILHFISASSRRRGNSIHMTRFFLLPLLLEYLPQAV